MKPHFVYYSLLFCLLIIFHVVYEGYVKGTTTTDGVIVYDNVSEVLYFCGFSMFYFLHGYQVKDFGKSKNTAIIVLLIIVFTLVSGINLDSDFNYADYTGLLDGTWLVWFIPVLGVFLLTSIPISGRKAEMHPYYKAWVAVSMVIVFVLLRIGFCGIVNFKACHLGKMLFFLPIFYMGYFYRTMLETKDYFIDYVRVSSWACASVLMAISLVFLRYMRFNLLEYSTIYEALMQITCIVMTITLFASLKQRCDEMSRVEDGRLVILSCVPALAIGSLLYKYLIIQDQLVAVMNSHFILLPLVLASIILIASYSIVLIFFVLYRLLENKTPKTR